ncbi:hypothetical protein CHISP_2075 [Chitinispirillum alkaliphilum]|nr:hypothetical protein CHISP_2075 [Chitinispirillum alkaliphilum]
MALQEELSINKSIKINRDSSYLFKIWRNPEYLPQILDFLEDVTALDENRSRWSVLIAKNERVEWETEIVEEAYGKLIAWHSEDSPYVLHEGRVRFTENQRDNYTRVDLALRFYFPLMEDSRSHMLGDDIAFRIEDDLYRFKLAVEGNEFPRIKDVRKGLPQQFPGKKFPH